MNFIDELTEAKEKMKGCYWKAFGIGALFILVMLVSCVTVVGPFIIYGPMFLGLHRAILQLVRTKKVKVSTLFSGFKDFGVAFRLVWLEVIKIFLWSLLLIVPGIIALIRYSMAFAILSDNPNMTAREAIDMSKEMMKDRKWEFFKNFVLYLGLAYLINIFSNRLYMFGIQEGLNGMVTVSYILSVVAMIWNIFVVPLWNLMLPGKFYKDTFSEEFAPNIEKFSENIIKEKKPRKPLSAKAKKIIAIVSGSVCGVLLAGGIFFGVKQVRKSSLVMVKVPGKNYSISRTEVTQKLYESVMGENPSYFCRDNEDLDEDELKNLKRNTSNCPVENVSWYDAIYFCNKLSKKNGLQPVYAVDGETSVRKWDYEPYNDDEIYGEITQDIFADGYRLPTVEEWLYAAKGGKNYRYSGSYDIDKVAWYEGNSNDVVHPVAQKNSNGYGLYDMSGNVMEWCWDSNGNERYYCGSYYGDYSKSCKLDEGLFHDYADFRDNSIGFRIVRSNYGSLDMVKIPGKDYSIGKTEVTQKLYESIMGENPSEFKGKDNPVENVSWYDAIYFCNKLSMMYGFDCVYILDGETDVNEWEYTPNNGEKPYYKTFQRNVDANGFKLPTPEEWSYAEKGGQNFKYAGSDNIDEVGWFFNNSKNTTHPVATKKANGYGLYDMQGNVSEWCLGSLKGLNWSNEQRSVTNIGQYNIIGFRLARNVD
ncbi:MAG: SUMF1/EgtB/PvdO family nonheme iron enzyme [Treponema sp.]|nr:MAG: SUMF1/EgtB/PvdO family nonheme iron enzyme [Treponema sp.]